MSDEHVQAMAQWLFDRTCGAWSDTQAVGDCEVARQGLEAGEGTAALAVFRREHSRMSGSLRSGSAGLTPRQRTVYEQEVQKLDLWIKHLTNVRGRQK